MLDDGLMGSFWRFWAIMLRTFGVQVGFMTAWLVVQHERCHVPVLSIASHAALGLRVRASRV